MLLGACTRSVPTFRGGKKVGMTRKEVVCCLTLGFFFLFFMAGLLTHVRHKMLQNAGATRMLSNGRALYMIIHEAYKSSEHDFPGPHSESVVLLPDQTYLAHGGTSTGYFRYLMELDIMPMDLGLFVCPETTVRMATSLETFTAERNEWSAVSGLSFESSDPSTPLFITRNLNESVLMDWKGREDAELERLGRRAGKEGWRTPYGHGRLVVIRMNGGGESIPGNRLRWRNLNPTSEPHPVLQP